MLVFKDVSEATLENRQNKLPEVKNKKVYIVYQYNARVDSNTFVKWLQLIWFRTYTFINIENSILYFERDTSHFSDEINDLFKQNKSYYKLKPPWMTAYYQPLDISINKPFKVL